MSEPRLPASPVDVARTFFAAAATDTTTVTRHGHGHIHDTYVATIGPPSGAARAAPHRLLLQRVNTTVFPDVAAMQENVVRVTGHLRRRLAAAGNRDPRAALHPLPARDGAFLVRDAQGGAWRAYEFIGGAHALERATTPAEAQVAARAFARFQRLLADYDGPPLHEVLPGFHDTEARLSHLDAAIAADPLGRAAAARAEIAAVAAQRSLAHVLLDLQRAGELPSRVVHNDTKINNLLFDDASNEPLSVVDLDTVMPGLGLYDFGDLVRTTAAERPEDEPNPATVVARPDFVVAAAAGWIEGAGNTLLPVERRHLVDAARLLCFECGVRFLTDHLRGDAYFRIARPGQNLERCRAQLALERSLAAQQAEIERRIAALPQPA